jgi:hypothetical protein
MYKGITQKLYENQFFSFFMFLLAFSMLFISMGTKNVMGGIASIVILILACFCEVIDKLTSDGEWQSRKFMQLGAKHLIPKEMARLQAKSELAMEEYDTSFKTFAELVKRERAKLK